MDDLVNLKPAIIIQARMGSTRLPGKVMLNIDDKPMIGYQIERLKKTNLPIIVATSIAEVNKPLVDYVKSLGIDIFRGSEHNVLERYFNAAKHYNANHIIRITGDNPLVDPNFIIEQLEIIEIEHSRYYISEGKDRKLPLGMSFEMFPFSILQEAYFRATTIYEKEHVTPYFHQNFSGDIITYSLNYLKNNSNLRLTVDTEADFLLIEELITKFDCHNKTIEDIIEIFNHHPHLEKINSRVRQKKWNE
jgi:spore coat polysaccharide biosynthesis protein SpsF